MFIVAVCLRCCTRGPQVFFSLHPRVWIKGEMLKWKIWSLWTFLSTTMSHSLPVTTARTHTYLFSGSFLLGNFPLRGKPIVLSRVFFFHNNFVCFSLVRQANIPNCLNNSRSTIFGDSKQKIWILFHLFEKVGMDSRRPRKRDYWIRFLINSPTRLFFESNFMDPLIHWVLSSLGWNNHMLI